MVSLDNIWTSICSLLRPFARHDPDISDANPPPTAVMPAKPKPLPHPLGQARFASPITFVPTSASGPKSEPALGKPEIGIAALLLFTVCFVSLVAWTSLPPSDKDYICATVVAVVESYADWIEYGLSATIVYLPRPVRAFISFMEHLLCLRLPTFQALEADAHELEMGVMNQPRLLNTLNGRIDQKLVALADQVKSKRLLEEKKAEENQRLLGKRDSEIVSLKDDLRLEQEGIKEIKDMLDHRNLEIASLKDQKRQIEQESDKQLATVKQNQELLDMQNNEIASLKEQLHEAKQRETLALSEAAKEKRMALKEQDREISSLQEQLCQMEKKEEDASATVDYYKKTHRHCIPPAQATKLKNDRERAFEIFEIDLNNMHTARVIEAREHRKTVQGCANAIRIMKSDLGNQIEKCESMKELLNQRGVESKEAVQPQHEVGHPNDQVFTQDLLEAPASQNPSGSPSGSFSRNSIDLNFGPVTKPQRRVAKPRSPKKAASMPEPSLCQQKQPEALAGALQGIEMPARATSAPQTLQAEDPSAVFAEEERRANSEIKPGQMAETGMGSASASVAESDDTSRVEEGAESPDQDNQPGTSGTTPDAKREKKKQREKARRQRRKSEKKSKS